MSLRDTFAQFAFVQDAIKSDSVWGRSLRRFITPDAHIEIPFSYLEKILRLKDPAFQPDSYFQTMLDFGLGVNAAGRHALDTWVVQSDPDAKVRYIEKADPTFGDNEDEERFFPASQLSVYSIYKPWALSKKRCFSLMIRPALAKAEDDITVAFGLVGEYDQGGDVLRVRKIMLRDQSQNRLRQPQLREDTVMMALEYGRLCTDAIFSKTPIDMQMTMHIVKMMPEEELKPAWATPRI